MKIAVLRNPNSARNRGRAAPVLAEGLTVHELSGLDALQDTLARVRADEIDLLVLDGGDGTIREVLSRLPEVFGSDMPMIGVIAGGNTNLAARKCGRIAGYATLLEWAGRDRSDLAAQARSLPVLRVEGLEQDPVRGLILGWGAYTTGTRIAVEEIVARGGKQVLRAVLAVLHRALFGEGAVHLRAGVEAQLSMDTRPAPPAARFAGIATAVDGALIAGLCPFWGDGAGAIRWLDIDAPARRLFLAAPFLALGRPLGWMTRAGYRSGRCEALSLRLDGGLVIDGEIFETDPEKALTITADERVSFVDL